MNQTIEKIYFIKERLKIFESLNKIFDLFHHYNEEKLIPKNFKSQEEVFYAQTNLHIINLSYTYSFFDKNGIDIRKLSKLEGISRETKDILEKITKLWSFLETPITKIRHNYGFHGGGKKQLNSLINASKELDKNNLLPDIVTLYSLLAELSEHLEKDIKEKFE